MPVVGSLASWGSEEIVTTTPSENVAAGFCQHCTLLLGGDRYR